MLFLKSRFLLTFLITAAIVAADQENSQHYSADEYSTEETKCSRNQFWHLQGKQCVPYHCPPHRPIRDQQTGRCKKQKQNKGETKTGNEVWFSRDGKFYPVGSTSFYQPRGLALNPMFMTGKNGRRQQGSSYVKQTEHTKFRRGR